MEKNFYLTVSKLRASTMEDLGKQLEALAAGPGQNRREQIARLVPMMEKEDISNIDIVEEVTYVCLLRLFVYKYILHNHIPVINGVVTEIPGILNAASLSEGYRQLAPVLHLFSENYAAYLFPSEASLNEIFSAESGPLTVGIHQDNFPGRFYEAYNFSAGRDGITEISADRACLANTQIYTPEWMGLLMAEATAGKFWKEMNPLSAAAAEMFTPGGEQPRLKMPAASMSLLDPACGSGNLLLIAFDLFFRFYLEQGTEKNRIPGLIIENNLFGFDIEDRAVQVARISLFLKAKQCGAPEPSFHFRICSAAFSLPESSPERVAGTEGNSFSKAECSHAFSQLRLAGKTGALMELDGPGLPCFSCFADLSEDRYINACGEAEKNLACMIRLFSRKYNLILANPPFLLPYNYGTELKAFLEKNYREPVDFTGNLYACFILKMDRLLDDQGLMGLVHPASLFYDPRLAGARDYVLGNLQYHFIFCLKSRAAFHDFLPTFDVLVSVLRKKGSNPESFFIMRSVSGDPEPCFRKIRKIFAEGSGQKKIRGLQKVSTQKAAFWLKHPFLYDHLFRYF